jgi:hypothetical protein
MDITLTACSRSNHVPYIYTWNKVSYRVQIPTEENESYKT